MYMNGVTRHGINVKECTSESGGIQGKHGKKQRGGPGFCMAQGARSVLDMRLLRLPAEKYEQALWKRETAKSFWLS
jgi:hypothetical protein